MRKSGEKIDLDEYKKNKLNKYLISKKKEALIGLYPAIRIQFESHRFLDAFHSRLYIFPFSVLKTHCKISDLGSTMAEEVFSCAYTGDILKRVTILRNKDANNFFILNSPILQ